MNLHKIMVPTPYSVGPVNSYLLPDDPCTLIDPGPDTKEGREALGQGLKEAGVKFEDIKQIVLTHFHQDHSGMAEWVREKAGALVFIHKIEKSKLTGEKDFFRERLPFLIEAGLSEENIMEIKGDGERQSSRPLLSQRIVSLSGGEDFAAGGMVWQVMHLPGHSTGHICFFEPVDGNFIAGDFLLERITPNPFLEVDPEFPARRSKNLELYLNGLNLVEKLSIKTVWPGHGHKFSNLDQVIKKGRQHHKVNCKKILDIIKEEGSQTALQIMIKMYPGLKGFEVFLGISEVLAHLDYMLDRCLVKIFRREKVLYYYL